MRRRSPADDEGTEAPTAFPGAPGQLLRGKAGLFRYLGIILAKRTPDMDPGFSGVEARIDAITRQLRDLEARLEALESQRPSATGSPLASQGQPERGERTGSGPAPAGPLRRTGTLALVGRTLMALSGAYFVRALTDSAFLPSAGGVVVGLLYAAWWLARCDRDARAGLKRSAVFHGAAAVMIADPLIWETTARFGVLDTLTAALLLWLVCVAALVVAWRGKLAALAWIGVVFAVASGLTLLVATRDLMPFTIGLLMLALLVEALAFRDTWLGLRWPAALGANLALCVAVLVLQRGSLPEGYAPLAPFWVVVWGVTLTVLYLASIAGRTLLRDRPLQPFEVVQAALAVMVGFGGATILNARIGASPRGLGVLSVLLGAAGYAVAFAFVERRPGRAPVFYFHSTLAGLLSLAGSRMLLAPVPLALLWSVLAVAAAWLGGRYDRVTLRIHGVLYVAAAAAMAGLVGGASDALIGPLAGAWRPIAPVAVVVAVVVACGYAILASTRGRETSSWSRLLPHLIAGLLLVWTVAGLGTRLLASVVAGAPGPAADAAEVAATRTVVVATLAVALAWAGRRRSLRELGWFVYPLLAAGALRLLLEDLRYGRPLTLFVSLASYGAALFVSPRLNKEEP